MEYLWTFGVLMILLFAYFVWNQKTRRQTLETTQEYMKKIAYILSAPFLAIIQFCFDFIKVATNFLLKLLSLLLLPFKSCNTLITHIDERFDEGLKEKMKQESATKRIKEGIQLYKEALMKDKQSFVNLSIQTVVLLGTIFLQYVSFATTYRGISFYFQEMAPGAAVFITLVIQCSLLVLANAIVHRQRFTAGRTLMMLYFMFTSMFFSFTGIVNQEISPEIDIRKNYSAFYKDYENLRNDVLSKSTQSGDTFSITSIDSDIKSLKNNAESMRSSIEQSLAAHQSQLDSSVKISYDENGYPVYDTTQKDGNLLTMIDKETQQINRLSELNKQLKPGQITLDALRDKAFEQKALEEKMKLLNDPSTGYAEVKQAYDQLAQYMKSIDSSLNIKALPETLGNYYRSFALQKKLQSEKCLDYDSLRAQVTTRKTDMTNVSDILAMQSLITREITDKFINTDLSDETIASESQYYAPAMKRSEEALHFEDINLVALARLHPSHKDFPTALFLLLLAIFVDGTTVLMPFFMNKTKKTILYANKRKDLRFEEEDILSDLMMQISDDPIIAYQKMDALLSNFTLAPYLQSKGYAMMCEEEVLHTYLKEDGKDMRDCVLFLQHCGYLDYITNDTLQILRKETGLEAMGNANVYLMKIKLVIWLKQNEAYAYQKSMREAA